MALDYNTVYLLLGSNLGDRVELISEAIELINAQVGQVFSRSAFYETAAWGREDQPSFVNVAVGVKTALAPLEVLNSALEIERALGRVRIDKWGSRLIDIDVILFGTEIIDIPDVLHIPHPQMQFRRFVLAPLAEIASDVSHPILHKRVCELLNELNDDLSVAKF